MNVSNAYLKPVSDLMVTLLMWFYFTVGFVLLFAPQFFAAYLFSASHESAFQRLNHNFFRGFFLLLRSLTPSIRWRISNKIKSIRSSIIVCNHLSYLDPLLLISLFPRHKTIVKGRFFKVPVFGWMVKQSGYIPSTAHGGLSALMIEGIESVEGFLESGGNLFIFPEGTRSRDGAVGRLNNGAFKIARRCQAQIQVIKIGGTGKLFVPGRFLLNTLVPGTITVEQITVVEPDYGNGRFSLSKTMSQVRSLLER
ncbi:MAG: lysophospholipid acyltransferase family protein [Thermodesulfobacteriota bacterium]